jgi:hypothetical protein
MKRLICLLPVILMGCAHFSTTQTDERTNQLTGETTKVTTRAASTTFFDSSSSLSQFKASQTEKTQTATVGSLTQEASGTNAANLINGIVGAAVGAAVKSVAPIPK